MRRRKNCPKCCAKYLLKLSNHLKDVTQCYWEEEEETVGESHLFRCLNFTFLGVFIHVDFYYHMCYLVKFGCYLGHLESPITWLHVWF